MTPTPVRWQTLLARIKACPPAVEFAERYDTFQQAWDACPQRRVDAVNGYTR